VVVRGDTVIEPPDTVYESAPEGTIVKVDPAQIVPLLTVTVGRLFTEIETTAVLLQVPLTPRTV
jgi:hypothetical protein